MTIRELIDLATKQSWPLIVVFCVPPVVAVLLRLFHGKGKGFESPWKYLYSVLVYWVCIPGMLSAVLTAYVLFFTKENLLDMPILVYGLPILSMAVSLLIISRIVTFKDIPGFGRLSGLIMMMAMTFVIILAISKTRIWLLFGGSIFMLFALAAGIFALLKWGAFMAFRRQDEPKQKPPSFP